LWFYVGYILPASLGYRPALENAFANGFRFELEGGYHNNSLDSAVISGTPTVVSKHVRIWSAMGNAFYDFRNESQWTPYIGAGAGWADVDLPTTSGLGNVDNDDKTFAYQFMGGLAFSPTTIPLTEWTLGYRYFALNNAKFSTGGGSKLKLDNYGSHNVELGARFRF
jgi:opacity protein-like surface antigen